MPDELTLRDKIAAEVMPRIQIPWFGNDDELMQAATWAYRVADALMEARTKDAK